MRKENKKKSQNNEEEKTDRVIKDDFMAQYIEIGEE